MIDVLLAVLVVGAAGGIVALAVWAWPRKRKPRVAHMESRRSRS